MTDNDKRNKALTKAYGNATARLRKAHQDEFDAFYTEEAASLGETWKPKPKPRDAAKSKVEELLQEFPELKDELLGQPEEGSVTEPTVPAGGQRL